MKRLLGISLCLLLFFSAISLPAVSVSAAENGQKAAGQTDYEKEIFILSGLQILEGFEDGSYHLEESLSRAQFAVFALRLLGVSDLEAFGEADFADVDAEHWAAGYISAARGLGLMHGYADGNFYPDRIVTRDEAVKILVCALGYHIQAKDGGYPSGYLAVAAKTGLLSGVSAQGGEGLSRGQAIRMLYNALEVPVMELVYDGGEKYKISGNSLMEILLSRLDLYRLRGTLEGAEESSLSGQKLSEDMALINGVSYRCELKGIADYIGVPVQFFVRDEEGTLEVVGMMPERNKYDEISFSAEEILSIETNEIVLERENGKEESLDLAAQLSILYNGFSADTYNLSDLNVTSGTVRLIDADRDGIYETAHIQAEKAFVIKDVESEWRMVYFRDRLYMGKGFVRLDDAALDMHYEILDSDGNLIPFEKLEAGMDISVAASTDFSRVRVQVLTDNTITGSLTQIGSNGEVMIDGESYLLAEDAKDIYAIDKADLKPGYIRTWHLDRDGKLFALDSENTSPGTYAYVMALERKKTLDSALVLKLLIGGSYVEIEDETSTETELEDRMVKQLQNKGIFEMETADKLIIDHYRYSAEEAASVLKKDTVICYQTDENGKVKEIKTAVLWGEENITERTYVKKMNLFESQGGGAFTIDQNTAILNLPKEDVDFGIYRNDSDCYVKTTLKDSAQYTAQAFDYNDDTKTAAAVVIQQDMSSDAAPEITTSTVPALVTGVKRKLNEEGDVIQVVSALHRGKAKELECRSEVSLSNIHEGDIVRFTEDGMERIAKIELAERLEKAMTPYHKDSGGIQEAMYGYVQKVELDTFTQYSSTMVSVITLSLDGMGKGERSFTIPTRETQPPVYVWNMEKKTGRVGSLHHFRAVDMSDVQNANMALIYAKSGAVQAIFIIN